MAAKNQKQDINPNLLIIGGLGILGYVGVLNPLLKFLGLKADAEDKVDEKDIANAVKSNGWDPAYFNNNRGKNYLMFSETKLKYVAKEIYDSWGINDDEDRIYAAFRQVPDLFRLSQLVGYYSKTYKQDLLSRLTNKWYYWKDGLDEKEFLYIADLVNKMPAYTKA